jgi:hypothetical protein
MEICGNEDEKKIFVIGSETGNKFEVSNRQWISLVHIILFNFDFFLVLRCKKAQTFLDHRLNTNRGCR